MTKQVKPAALYVRVSTDAQTVENQIRELSQIAERRGWQVIGIYRYAGISGAKGETSGQASIQESTRSKVPC
jgi:DNA invertase Pin-like site-specific DNA recombinase